MSTWKKIVCLEKSFFSSKLLKKIFKVHPTIKCMISPIPLYDCMESYNQTKLTRTVFLGKSGFVQILEGKIAKHEPISPCQPTQHAVWHGKETAPFSFVRHACRGLMLPVHKNLRNRARKPRFPSWLGKLLRLGSSACPTCALANSPISFAPQYSGKPPLASGDTGSGWIAYPIWISGSILWDPYPW